MVYYLLDADCSRKIEVTINGKLNEFLLRDDLKKGRSSKSMEYINYIACMEKSQRLRVRFKKAKTSCIKTTNLSKVKVITNLFY